MNLRAYSDFMHDITSALMKYFIKAMIGEHNKLYTTTIKEIFIALYHPGLHPHSSYDAKKYFSDIGLFVYDGDVLAADRDLHVENASDEEDSE